MDKLHQQRKDALEILAKYSDEALNELQATLKREKSAERMVDSLDDPTSAEKKVTEKENEAKLKRTLDEIDDLHKSIQDMSRKELEEVSKKIEEISEELPKSDE